MDTLVREEGRKRRIVLLTLFLLFRLSAAQNSTDSCYCSHSGNCDNSTCDPGAGGCCASEVIVYNNGSTVLEHLCIGEFLKVTCNRVTNLDDRATYVACCNNGDLCNKCLLHPSAPLSGLILPDGCPSPSLFTPFTSTSSPSPSSIDVSPSPSQLPLRSSLSLPLLITIIVLSSVVAVLLCAAIAVFCIVFYKKRVKRRQVDSMSNLADGPFVPDPSDIDSTTVSCSSGAGATVLEERTLGKQIKKKELIGKGRYGEVWRGDWQGESVAVKIFSPLEEESWKREDEIYQTKMLNHDNVVRVIATEKKNTFVRGMELWLVMEYHPNGSLFEYLQNRSITPKAAYRIILSIASGLHYIHLDVSAGHSVKPGIAHRDIKSRNILVKSDGSCCITDFGLAIRHDLAKGTVDKIPPTIQQGTRRYMAPEILGGTINPVMFESYKMVDIYCFGLVMWEVAQRCHENGNLEYQLPYYNSVSHDPSLEEMHKVVVLDEVRPPIEQNWKNDEMLDVLASLMRECWTSNPHARLTAFRIKKTLLASCAVIKNGSVKSTI